jgi:glycolate oxidase
MEGGTKEALQETYEKAGNTCLENGALEVFVADNKFASEKIWNMRRNWLEALKVVDPYVSTGDVVSPLSEISRMMEKIGKIATAYGVQIPCAGHAADGNIHPAPMKPEDIPLSDWKEMMEEILDKIAAFAVELGGAVSGERRARNRVRETEVARKDKGARSQTDARDQGRV